MRIIILLLFVIFSQNSLASTLKINYSLFFGYMKTMYKLDYAYVTTNFYLLEQTTGEQCFIKTAEIVVDNKREKIDFKKEGQLMPFFSDQHRKDGAMIEVDTVKNEACSLQVTLMAKELALIKPSFKTLTSISNELEGVLRKNAGMIGKYFLPAYSGLRFKLVTPLAPNYALPSGYIVATNGDLLVSNEALFKTQESKLLPFEVSRITPWIEKSL